MGVEFGLDASLDSMRPPLLNFAADTANSEQPTQLAVGTDQRSYQRAND